VIPDEEVERVREAADVVAIVGEFVPLRRVGATYRGPCPFHQGKHRNFSVDPRRKIFHCFVCGEGGDVFTFLRKRLGVDWPTAVRMTAEKVGIELREVRAKREGPDPREPLWEVNAAAQEYFRRLLWEDPRGVPAREYLARREISREIADRFGLGYAPRDGEPVREHLATLGFDDARQLDSGLLVRREGTNALRPRFRARLMFGIFDLGGRIAGFGGRLLGPGEPKYLNSPDSIAFTKGKLLYGLNWARAAVRRAERVLLVEGYFDLLRVAVAGREEVVAPLGTALTSDQAQLITRYTKNVFLLYDSDKAGLRATFRAGDELLRHGASVRVVSLPEGHDPDTWIREQGPEALERKLGEAIDVFERKIAVLQRGEWFADLHRRRRAIDHLLPTIRAASDPVTRDLYIGRAAEASGVDRRILADEAAQPAQPGESAARVRRPGAPADLAGMRAPPRSSRPHRAAVLNGKGSSAERELIRVMLALRSTVERIGERVGAEQFRDVRYRQIFEVLSHLGPDAPNERVAAALNEEARPAFEALLAGVDAILDVEKTIHDCLSRLDERALRDRNAEIQRLLPTATEAEKDQLALEKQTNVAAIGRLRQSRQASGNER
jgi:DNA primase